MRDVEYLSTAETAAAIRKTLAANFPGIKFWVRSDTYAGGSSIDIYYDGRDTSQGSDGYDIRDWDGRRTPIYRPGAPTKEEVEKVCRVFAGGGFDGMIDLSYYIDAYLDGEGKVVGTVSEGTEGSRGTVAAWKGPGVTERRVHFGADHVFVRDEPPFDVREKRGT